mmetsp:Transcript_11744/g.21370  ORF Transcript_11744/g.21370 Transcript_11744/m.21370 type:complete len:260 (-) Transcript_11744:55-834(-)
MLALQPTPLSKLAEADTLENGIVAVPLADRRTLLDDTASEEEWAEAFPISSLPPLRGRGGGYLAQTLLGSAVVGGFCMSLVFLTHRSARSSEGGLEASWSWCLIKVWATIACLCTAHILFWNPNEIRRSPKTCYPIPEEVVRRLLAGESLDDLHNIRGPTGSDRYGTYCVRCLVWRPPSKESCHSHHCSTCSRCVTHFDHHCGVYGRCIVRGNLIPFYFNLVMLPVGIITALLAMANAPDNDTWFGIHRNSTIATTGGF